MLQQMIKNSQQSIRSGFADMSVNTAKRKKDTMSDMSETISYQRTNFFFIKSKHAFREYKNHEYFQTKQQRKDTIDHLQSTQFVQSPTPFGINNAYQYMCDQVSKNYLRKKPNNQRHISIKAKQAVKRHRRSVNLTLPNLHQLNYPSKILKAHQTDKLVSNNESSIEQSDLPLQSSLGSRNFELDLISGTPLSREYFITIVYISKFESEQRVGNVEIKVNIFSFIMKTFLKAKLNYYQMTNEQFSFIVNKIVQTYQMEPSAISLKDIINCKYIRQIFQLLQQYSHYAQEQTEIIRHFFVANEQVYRYQFNCIKDQIRSLINLQVNCLNNDEQLYIFQKGRGKAVNNLFQLLQYNNDKFIIGVDQNAYHLYKTIMKQKNSKKQVAERIKKWKSIVPNQSQIDIDFQQITHQKYQHLFQKVQKKRSGLPYSKKKPNHYIKNPVFIARQKLIKSQSIFQ